MEFKDRIKSLRQDKSLTLTNLANIFEKSEAAIRSWETGRSKPDADTLIKLAEYFDCTTDYLLGLSSYENQNRKIEMEQNISDLSIKLDGLPPNDRTSIFFICKALLESYDILMHNSFTKDSFLNAMALVVYDIRDISISIYQTGLGNDKNILLADMFKKWKNSNSTIDGLFSSFEEYIRNMTT